MSDCSGHTDKNEKVKATKECNLAVKLRKAGEQMIRESSRGQQYRALLGEAAKTLEENARIVELAAHPECPANLGLGGTVAWHREKINQLRQRPQA